MELLHKELRSIGLDYDIREYYLDCDRYEEAAENLRMTGFVDDLSAWGAELVGVLDDQATYALMACRHPLVRKISVVFGGVNYPISPCSGNIQTLRVMPIRLIICVLSA